MDEERITILCPPVNILKLQLPRTERIDFEKLFPNVDETSKETLRKMSVLRDRIVTSIANSGAEAGISAVTEYLPYLLGLSAAAEKLPESFTKKFRVTWTSTVGYSKADSFNSHSFHFEIIFVLLILGFLHRESAANLLATCTEDTFGERAAEIGKKLCTAAGTFQYIHAVQLARWSTGDVKSRKPLPDNLSETFLALESLCLAEAQQIVVKKALAKMTSFGLLIKLCNDVYHKYKHSYDLLQRLAIQDDNTAVLIFENTVRSYLYLNGLTFGICSLKMMAILAHQKEQYGLAVAHLKAAKQACESKITTDIVKKLGTSKVNQSFLASAWEQMKMHINDLDTVYRKYEQENRSIYYEPVPQFDISQLTEARSVMKVVPFSPEAAEVNITVIKGQPECVVM